MKKKAKGKSPQQLKQEQACQKNIYLQKLKSVMDSISCEPAFHLLVPRETEILYLARLRPLKLKFAEIDGHPIPGEIVKSVNDYLTKILKQTMVQIDNEGFQINSYDFYTFVETIYLSWRNTQDDSFPNAHKFLERFPLFNNGYKTKRVEAMELIDTLVKQLAWKFTHITERIAWIEPVNNQSSGGIDIPNFYNNYLVHFERPESECLEVDGNKRSIFRVGVGTENGIRWLSLTPEKLGIHGLLNKFPLKVYVQKHAVDRIKERLGDNFHTFNFFLITTAIINCEVYPVDGDGFLISCKFDSLKLGYLKASIIGDKILIRTFLFLTNNSTPEGKKLENLFGIQKEDKKYLRIDKLNLFINSDIEQSENLKTIFCQAGCGHLFQFKKYFSGNQDHFIQCAASFSKYLRLEN